MQEPAICSDTEKICKIYKQIDKEKIHVADAVA